MESVGDSGAGENQVEWIFDGSFLRSLLGYPTSCADVSQETLGRLEEVWIWSMLSMTKQKSKDQTYRIERRLRPRRPTLHYADLTPGTISKSHGGASCPCLS